MMDKALYFIKNNYPAFIIGIFFYLLYLQFAFSGNRICDCEETEKHNTSSSHHRVGGINRFYHK